MTVWQQQSAITYRVTRQGWDKPKWQTYLRKARKWVLQWEFLPNAGLLAGLLFAALMTVPR